MRQIVLDTETTGLSWEKGNRVVEIGCVELIERRPSGRRFQRYLRPDCPFEPGAQEVTGLTLEFLADKPAFADVVEEFIEFVRGAELVIHNAAFDVGFLDNELMLAGPAHGRLGDHATGAGHAGTRARALPWSAQQPRCLVQAPRGRQFAPGVARRVAGRAVVDRGLPRADGRPGRSRLGRTFGSCVVASRGLSCQCRGRRARGATSGCRGSRTAPRTARTDRAQPRAASWRGRPSPHAPLTARRWHNRAEPRHRAISALLLGRSWG
jgi:hypothetical protein